MDGPLAENMDLGDLQIFRCAVRQGADPGEDEAAIGFEGPPVSFVLGEPDTIVPAHAATMHKAQGRSIRRWSVRS